MHVNIRSATRGFRESHILVIASFHRLISAVLTWRCRLRREVGNLGVASVCGSRP